ncbi:MAG TPA: M48 family metalloprotease, partial [Longimicrobiaceae bacterium]|nr:M48 family metalloprotease [Longimicrobiaceae bacterium]
NAYVTGFGGSKRIVLWDTLLRKLAPRETLFVMGHEMGHYVLGHLLLVIALASVLTLVSLYAIHRSAGWLIARYRRRFGFDELGDIASYPLLILVAGIVGLAVTPAVNALTRYVEHEADRFALELTRDNHAAATAFVKLQEQNLSVPYPGTFYRVWRSTHPPLGERTEFANDYRPWETGVPLKYGEHFEQGGR